MDFPRQRYVNVSLGNLCRDIVRVNCPVSGENKGKLKPVEMRVRIDHVARIAEHFAQLIQQQVAVLLRFLRKIVVVMISYFHGLLRFLL